MTKRFTITKEELETLREALNVVQEKEKMSFKDMIHYLEGHETYREVARRGLGTCSYNDFKAMVEPLDSSVHEIFRDNWGLPQPLSSMTKEQATQMGAAWMLTYVTQAMMSRYPSFDWDSDKKVRIGVFLDPELGFPVFWNLEDAIMDGVSIYGAESKKKIADWFRKLADKIEAK